MQSRPGVLHTRFGFAWELNSGCKNVAKSFFQGWKSIYLKFTISHGWCLIETCILMIVVTIFVFVVLKNLDNSLTQDRSPRSIQSANQYPLTWNLFSCCNPPGLRCLHVKLNQVSHQRQKASGLLAVVFVHILWTLKSPGNAPFACVGDVTFVPRTSVCMEKEKTRIAWRP